MLPFSDLTHNRNWTQKVAGTNSYSCLTYFSSLSPTNYRIAVVAGLILEMMRFKRTINFWYWFSQYRNLKSFLCYLCREQIFRQSTELVCRAYEEVYTALTSPANGYKDSENLVPISPKQVQTLLSWETILVPRVSLRQRTVCRVFKELCNLYSTFFW